MATDNVAVKVNEDPAFSAILVADVARVTVGALSLSVIVIVCDVVDPASAPTTLAIETVAVSLPS